MTNPLAGHFRKPSIFIRLPSGGNLYPEGTFKKPDTDEVPVLPMTAVDEITYRTPDALFNGTATVEVIKSCVPSIIDPWEMPGIDFDTVMVAIRIASFGNMMDIVSPCPHCSHENEFELDLSLVLADIPQISYSKPLNVDGLEIFFKPLTYRNIYENQMAQFEEQRSIRTASDENTPPEERLKILNDTLKSLSRLSTKTTASCISVINTESGTVTDANHILEYVENVDRKTYLTIRNRAVELKSAAELKPLHIVCQNDECKKEYVSPFTLDSASFFDQDS